MKTLLLLMLLLAPAPADDDLTKKIESQYDRFKDETTVSVRLAPKITKGYLTRTYMTLFAKYKGQAVSGPPETVVLAFFTESKRLQFLNRSARRWIFIADGKRAEMPDISYSNDVVYGGVIETLAFGAGPEVLQTLTLPKLLEFQIGSVEGRFTDNDMKLMKAYADYLR